VRLASEYGTLVPKWNQRPDGESPNSLSVTPYQEAKLPSLYLVGTADTKAEELDFLREIFVDSGVAVTLVDVGTKIAKTAVDVSAESVAVHHSGGSQSVFSTDDRGTAVSAMGMAFANYCTENASDIAAIIGIGGGGTSIITAGMRCLPFGVPKVMVSTLASGDTAAFVGVSDIMMMPTITDLAGINRISRTVLYNSAQAILGMSNNRAPAMRDAKPAVGLTMFGVTTTCVSTASDLLRQQFEPLIFHATGTGGQAMESLAKQGEIAGVLDFTLTEICDLLFGGVLPCLPNRLDVVAQNNLPWVGSLGALDMINFWAPGTVPAVHKSRLFYYHNPNVTLMRTTPEENATMGAWIGEKLNACAGPVRLMVPERGISDLDIDGGAFWDPDANSALIQALEDMVNITSSRQIIRVPHHINDPQFAQAAVENFLTIISDTVK